MPNIKSTAWVQFYPLDRYDCELSKIIGEKFPGNPAALRRVSTHYLDHLPDMLQIFNPGRNGFISKIKRFPGLINGCGLERRRFSAHTDLATSIIRDAHKSFTSGPNTLKTINEFGKLVEGLEELILSKEETLCTMKMCLELDHLNHKVFRNCIELIEDEYFKPILLQDDNGIHPLMDLEYKNIDNPHEFINSLSIKHKSTIIIWTYIINQKRFRSENEGNGKFYEQTESIDPEKEEITTTRKIGKVLDPKPIRARISRIPSGKKLSNMLAFQLRELIPDASLSELCYISHIFTTNLPLSGQLNEDTIDLLARRFCEFSPSELAAEMYSISKFCRSATRRFNEIWSFYDPNTDRVPIRRHCLYKIQRRQLQKPFILKVLEALKLYCKLKGISKDAVNPYLWEKSRLIPSLHVILDLSHSDIPISISLWDKLVVKINRMLNSIKSLSWDQIGLYCEAAVVSKYTTENTIEVVKNMFGKCNTPVIKINEHYRIAYILQFISENCLESILTDAINSLSDYVAKNYNDFDQYTRLNIAKQLSNIKNCTEGSSYVELRKLIEEDSSLPLPLTTE